MLCGRSLPLSLRARFKLWEQGPSGRFLVLLDQSIYTGTNFSLTALLALLAGVLPLGHYAIIASIAALLSSVFVGLVLDPLIVFASAPAARRVRFALLKLSAAISMTALAVAVGLEILNRLFVLPALADIAFATVIFAGQSVVLCHKRNAYINGQVLSSLYSSIRYAAAAFLVVALVWLVAAVEVWTVVVAIGAASCASSLVWFRSILRIPTRVLTYLMKAPGLVRYALWSSVISVPSAVAVQSIYWIADVQAGRLAVGQIKVLEQLMVPFVQIMQMLSLPDQVAASKAFSRGDVSELIALSGRRTGQQLKYCLLYCLGLVAFLSAAQGITVQAVPLTAAIIYSVCVIAQSVAIPRNVVLRAARRPKFIAFGYVVMVMVMIVSGILAVPSTVIGAVAALSCAWAANVFVLQLGQNSLIRAHGLKA